MKELFSDRDIGEKLFRYARQGRVVELEKLIAEHSQQVRNCINTLDNNNLTALHYAARNGQLGLVKLLVEEAYADVNAESDDKTTPLHFAARYRRKTGDLSQYFGLCDQTPNLAQKGTEQQANDADNALSNLDSHEPLLGELIPDEPISTDDIRPDPVIHYLIEHGALLNGKDIYGWTPLHYAAVHGNEVATQQLLMEPDIDTEATDHAQMRPIHLAATHGETGIVRQLLAAGAKPCEKSRDGCLPLHFACSTGNLELTELLTEKSNSCGDGATNYLNSPNIDEETPLHWATGNGNSDVVRYCIEQGADPNLTSRTGETCLHMAARVACLETVNFLLQRGINIDSEDRLLQSALHKASERNNLEVMKLLVQSGSDMENQDLHGYTPFLVAASRGHVKAAQLLIELGADVFAVEKNNKSVVYLCAEANRVELLQVILQHPQASNLVKVPTIYDSTPLHVAAKRGHFQIVKLLVDYGANISAKTEKERTPLHYAAKKGHLRIACYLLEHTPSLISELDEDRNAPIHLAAANGHRALLKILLESGAAVDCRNNIRWTPLDCAAANGHHDCVEFLLQNNSPVSPKDVSNTTPLHLACSHGHPKVVELLLDWGADPGIRVILDDSQPRHGPNALDAAIDNGQRACARLILKSPYWKQAMQNQLRHDDGTIDTPMRKLIRWMPDLAEFVLDRCCETNDLFGKYNFEFIDDTYVKWSKSQMGHRNDEVATFASAVRVSVGDWTELVKSPFKTFTVGQQPSPEQPYSSNTHLLKENHPLMLMVKFNRPRLLQHRIITELLKHKWSRVGLIYYLNLGLYLMYLLFFSVYMLNMEPVHATTHNISSEGTLVDSPRDYCRQAYNGSTDTRAATLVLVAKYSILILALINLAKELFQLCYNGYRYATIENAMECAIFTLGLIVVVDFDDCFQRMQLKTQWQWECGSAGLFLTWLNLLLFLRRIPTLGIYVLMFTVIMRTFSKFFVVFLLFIVAFAFGFHTLLSNHVAFNSIGNSLLKTTVMMLGELEFDSIFNEQAEAILFTGVTYSLFVVFLVVMTIVIMNLLVGLAVDDIKGVQNEAVVKRLAMQIELFLDIETLLPHLWRHYWDKYVDLKELEQPSTGIPGRLARWRSEVKKHWKRQLGVQSEDGTTENRQFQLITQGLSNLESQTAQLLDRQTNIMRAIRCLTRLVLEMRPRRIEVDELSSVDSEVQGISLRLEVSPHGTPSSNRRIGPL